MSGCRVSAAEALPASAPWRPPAAGGVLSSTAGNAEMWSIGEESDPDMPTRAQPDTALRAAAAQIAGSALRRRRWMSVTPAPGLWVAEIAGSALRRRNVGFE